MEAKSDAVARYSDPEMDEFFNSLESIAQDEITEYKKSIQEEIIQTLMDPKTNELWDNLSDSKRKRLEGMNLLDRVKALKKETSEPAEPAEPVKTVNFDDMVVEDSGEGDAEGVAEGDEEEDAASLTRSKRTRSFQEEEAEQPRVRPRREKSHPVETGIPPGRETGRSTETTRPSAIYSPGLITKNISLEMKFIGSNIKEVLETKLRDQYEGKCINEGYIKPRSIKIISYSSGLLKGSYVSFEIVFQCEICFLVVGQLLSCSAKNITKAGIRGESSNERPSPFVVFVSRDYQVTNPVFSEIRENDTFVARVIGQRFELNDAYISVIAEIADKGKKVV